MEIGDLVYIPVRISAKAVAEDITWTYIDERWDLEDIYFVAWAWRLWTELVLPKEDLIL